MNPWKLVTLLACVPGLAQGGLAISGEDGRSSLFGGRPASYAISVAGRAGAEISVTWELSAHGRVLSRGNERLELDGDGQGSTELTLTSPAPKAGVVLESKLSVEAVDIRHRQDQAIYRAALDLYGPDALMAERPVIDSRQIKLFDPGGATAELLDSLQIAHEALSRSALLQDPDPGFVVIGRGTALDAYRGLATVLLEKARGGHKILILEASSGTLPLDPPDDGTFSAGALSLSDDPDLPWFPSTLPGPTAEGLALVSHRDAVNVGVVPAHESRWYWMELNFRRSGGRLTLCMFPVMDGIEDRPLSQVTLGRLLVHASR